MLNLPDNVSPAEMQKTMMKAGTELEALTTKRCGVDPTAQWNEAKRIERLKEIEGQASDALAPAGGAPPEADPTGVLATGPWAPSIEDAQDTSHPYLRKYSLLKERWIPFCNGLATAPNATAKGKYATVKGVGNGVYVYSSEEAAVMASNCVDVMSDIGKTLEFLGRSRLP
jgi:hypothetical protein